MRHTLIVSGGNIDDDFGEMICAKAAYHQIIGVDRGLEFLYRNHTSPTDIVGDFDSLDAEVLAWYRNHTAVRIRQFEPEKDLTDTEIAVRMALEYGTDEITILGATGSRLDHVLGNIQLLRLGLRAGVRCVIMDPYNHVELLDQTTRIQASDCHGPYISLLPATGQVTGITLEGFKYPLHDYTMTSDNSIGISNELIAETGIITIEKGILIKVEATD